MENGQAKRENFSSGIAVFFATLGSAVGLGNIWKFPYLTGTYGGGAFLFVYIICVLFVGIPVMICEFYLGRKTRKNAVGAFNMLSPDTKWSIVGFMGVISSYLIMFFYSCVAGWVYSYIFKALKGDFNNVTVDIVKSQYTKAVVGPIPPLIWQFIVMIVVSLILIAGIQKGIEKVTKTLLPILFLLILVCDIRALTLPGAREGLKFLFEVDFSKITPGAMLTALGLSFFKLSLGMGIMITYSSYYTQDNNMIGNSLKVTLSDTIVSLLAGIAIFPAIFSFNMEPEVGPGLLFMTIPLVFSRIPFGNVLLVAFFFLTAIAATTAMISLLEVPVAYYTEEKGMPRKQSVVYNALLVFAIGILATLSIDKESILGNFEIFGKTFYDLFDFISSSILMPIGGLLTIIFIGYFSNKDDVRFELTNGGALRIGWIVDFIYFIIRYIAPILLVVIFLTSIGVIRL